MEKLRRYIRDHRDEFLEDLRTLVNSPSVSAWKQGLPETARLVVALLEKYGFKATMLQEPEMPPVVYGELKAGKPVTVLCYTHYDVQPPDPLELWETPPFEFCIRDGKAFGRGVCDDKGHLVARLAAVRALEELYGGLPVNVKLFAEGEEEIGSPHLGAFLQKHGALLQAQGCLWESGGVDGEGRPLIYTGIKGMLSLEIRAQGARSDMHSSYGVVVSNPAWRLVQALSTLKDLQERVTIEGFYHRVRPPLPAEEEAVKRLPDQTQLLKELWGVKEFLLGVQGVEFYRRLIFEPTLNIDGLYSGYIGEGTKTVLPRYALAKLDFRLVPDQDPQEVLESLRKHLTRLGFDDLEIIVGGMLKPARTPVDHPFVQKVVEAAQDVYGREPSLYPNSTGSGPMYPFVADMGLPVASAGIGYPGSQLHAPNEHIRLEDFERGILHTAMVFLKMGEG